MMRGVLATVAAVAIIAAAFVLIRNGVFNPGATPSPTPSAPPVSGPPSPTGTPTSPPPSIPTATPTALPTPVDTSVVASGVVVPLLTAELATRVSGVVASTYVQEGSAALANQLLLKLEQSTYQARIDVVDAEVRHASAAAEQAQLQLDQLPIDASPGLIESVQANLRLAQAALELATTRLSEAQNALLQTEIRAPFAGTVAELNVEVGEQAMAGQAVIVMGDLSGWFIETTDVSELEVTRVGTGDRATVTFEAIPDLSLGGTIDRIKVRGRTADGAVVYAVTVRPDSHVPELRWGMTATVRIPSR